MIAGLVLFGLVLVLLIFLRSSLLHEPGGRLLAFAAVVALPVLLTVEVGTFHLEHAKRTRFCLSCHEMTPFGDDLHQADGDLLSAAHYQDHLVPPERACHACHTDYAMHGDLRAKLRGLRHAWIHYVGPPVEPEAIALYQPYRNRNCLHCHEGARSFEAAAAHRPIRDALSGRQVSCLACHRPVHGARRSLKRGSTQTGGVGGP